MLFYTFSTVMVSNEVAEDGVASAVEETTISGDVQDVVGCSVDETVAIDDEGTNFDAAQEVVASVEESITISAETAVEEGSQQDTVQGVFASVQESITILFDEAFPPSMVLDAEVIASSDDNVSVEKLQACFSGLFKDCVDTFSIHRNKSGRF